jgi:A/G-specific adenine glycosylase
VPTVSKSNGKKVGASKPSEVAIKELPALSFTAAEFRRKLNRWYREHARELPWRGVDDPYATWLSEIMLQQTRVATVIDRYQEFLLRFPTIRDLANADETDVLALWSGLGYYRRARMLHRGAQFVERELEGKLPQTVLELRTLPGIGEYTAAAIASIAFGESVSVLDGNVERVLLRLLGEPEEKSAQARARLVAVAGMLAPPAKRGRTGQSNAAVEKENPAGDHNQAMMELGAMICLPRSPLCLQCPVMELCKTRGEHATAARAKMQSRTVAHLLALRKRGVETEVLLERRADGRNGGASGATVGCRARARTGAAVAARDYQHKLLCAGIHGERRVRQRVWRACCGELACGADSRCKGRFGMGDDDEVGAATSDGAST